MENPVVQINSLKGSVSTGAVLVNFDLLTSKPGWQQSSLSYLAFMGSRACKAILPQAQHGAESAEQTSPHMRNPQPGTTPESTGSHITD